MEIDIIFYNGWLISFYSESVIGAANLRSVI